MSDATSFDPAQVDPSVKRTHQLIQKHSGNPLLSNVDIAEIVKIMNLKYAAYLKDRFFEVKITGDDRSVEATILLRDTSGKYYYPVEAKALHFNQEANAKDLALLILDYMDLYFQEFFESDELTFLPIDWTDYQCEGLGFMLKGQILNLEAELAASKLLGDEVEVTTPTNPTLKQAEDFKKHWASEDN